MGDLCKEFVDIPLGSVIYHEKFAGSGRSRLDKSAEVSACKRHMPDTCAFVPTSCKAFLRNYGKQKKCQRTLDTNFHSVLFENVFHICYIKKNNFF